jgi:hypothetical protein
MLLGDVSVSVKVSPIVQDNDPFDPINKSPLAGVTKDEIDCEKVNCVKIRMKKDREIFFIVYVL